MSLYLGNTPIANTGYDKANIDLSNLTSIGKNIANWSNNVTNCITEIPQDIKLELNDGTLTLKAGSKVYVPNGSGVFDVHTTSIDRTYSSWSSATGKGALVLSGSSYAFVPYPYPATSGTTPPSTGLFYNTTENKIQYYQKGSLITDGGISLPLAIVNFESGTPTSIDQVFNGFGYIGSTVFALPGVKGLIPNGRNTDGSLKNIEITSSQVWTRTWTSNQNYHDISLATTGIGLNTNTYNEEENFVYNAGGVKVTDRVVFGRMEYNSSSPWNITSLQVKTAFHAVDYNDSSTISGWSMPSNNYDELTIAASEAGYIAPANGYFIAVGAGNSTEGGDMIIRKWTNGNYEYGTSAFLPNSYGGFLTLPVKKGDNIGVYYNRVTMVRIRFYYAEGEN